MSNQWIREYSGIGLQLVSVCFCHNPKNTNLLPQKEINFPVMIFILETIKTRLPYTVRERERERERERRIQKG